MGVNTQLFSDDSIEVVVAIPAYNERETLPIIVKELSLFLSEKDAILILDELAAIKPAAKRSESPVIKGTKAPTKKPVPTKTNPHTTM